VKAPRAALLAVVIALGAAACGADAAEQPAVGPGEVEVVLEVEHSYFDQERLRVVEGTEVTFVVRNGDPIGHELIVGPPDVHRRHEDGTEAAHPPRPGEVSVAPNEDGSTTYTFDEVGTVEFACHLPGHYDHGMHGEVEVVPAA
jgi:uncharacterized cupredoxin-like copper-binding protein